MLNFFQSSKQLPPERQYITHPSTTFPVPLYVILGSGIHENAFCKWKMCDFKYVKFIFELFFLEMLYVTQMIPPWFCTDLEPSSHCICGLNLNWIWVMVDELWQFPLLNKFHKWRSDKGLGQENQKINFKPWDYKNWYTALF